MPHPDEVFTPRKAAVNDPMYVSRPNHEAELGDALRGHRHMILFGLSGCGKSWLYKMAFKGLDVYYAVANLALAERLGSVHAVIENVLKRDGGTALKEVEDEKKAKAGIVAVQGELTNKRKYDVHRKEPYEATLEFIRAEAKKRPAVLVLENLEMIFGNPKLMEELAGLIILADDERYAAYEVKILIVGVPAVVRDFFNRTPNRATVANRLIELSEVSRMSEEEAHDLIRRGFHHLNIPIREAQLRPILSHITWVTDKIPQRLHEYCLELARRAERVGEVFLGVVEDTDRGWLKDSLSECYALVESLMNDRDTKIGRRNQVLFAIGQVLFEEFRHSDVEQIVRKEFDESSKGKSLSIGGILAELTKGAAPMLRRSPKGDGFLFTDPKYRMCIRSMLVKGSAGTVQRVDIGTIGQRSAFTSSDPEAPEK